MCNGWNNGRNRAGLRHNNQRGGIIADGTARFIIDDVRDAARVGSISASLYVPDGYLLADGSTKNRADYPRLVALVEKYNLWTDDTANNLGKYGTGDNSTTFVLPNLMNRHIKYANTAGGTLEAGLPNITAKWINQLYVNKNDLVAHGGYSHEHQYDLSGAAGLTTWSSEYSSIASIDNNWFDGTLSLDASKSSSIYGNSSTVQPPAVQYLPIIKY